MAGTAGSSHPLDGCLTKLARAKTHLTALRGMIRSWAGPEPDRLAGEFEPATGDYIFRAVRDVAVPREVPAVIGDVVHNIFAALDYLAWELVIVNRQTGTTQTAFPIFDSAAKFDSDAPRKMKGMSPDAQGNIRRLQPFQVSVRDGHPSEQSLMVLYALEMADKHRSLNVLDPLGLNLIGGLPGHIVTGPGPLGALKGPLTKGMEAARLKNLLASPQTDLYLEVTHTIVFGPSGPAPAQEVVGVLSALYVDVSQRVVPAFRRFFA